MPFFNTLRAAYHFAREGQHAYAANNQKLLFRLTDVFWRTWDLGFTAFGGPPVHFQIIHRRFVEGHGGKTPWIDEQTYHELFALSQALPGPASTKMLFSMVHLHAGLVSAIFAFLLWSLPGAIGMFCLALGVRRIGAVLPDAVSALLSGLNASTVGIVALAAVQLAEKAITDNMSRILVIFGACAGLCYNALWYFPSLILAGGLANILWNLYLRQLLTRIKQRWKQRRNPHHTTTTTNLAVEDSVPEETGDTVTTSRAREEDTDRQGLQRRPAAAYSTAESQVGEQFHTLQTESNALTTENQTTNTRPHGISVLIGCIIICCFFATFIAVLVLRTTLEQPARLLNLFNNMYLAGTIIFGGGPVVIPLLREYVVEPGWVSSRDFLIGLAIIQAFPGPNFNFAVYLGSLAMLGTGTSFVFGALVAFIGIFTPGLVLSVGVQGFWRKLRTKPIATAGLAGINATAVGLVFTAVYRLWQIGYLSSEYSQGQSLALEPWWVVVTVVTYAEAAWFNVPPAPAILFGAVLGLAWYGAVGVR